LIKVRVTTAGVEPSTVGGEPSTAGVEPSTVGGEPSTAGGEPSTAGSTIASEYKEPYHPLFNPKHKPSSILASHAAAHLNQG
jgi:hypothetical protein